MQVNDIKELKALLKLCRSQGVTEITLGAVSFKLGDLPEVQSVNQSHAQEEVKDPLAGFPDGILTPEQLMYYSSGGLPSEDPENQQEAS
jgi:hypothetical protein